MCHSFLLILFPVSSFSFCFWFLLWFFKPLRTPYAPKNAILTQPSSCRTPVSPCAPGKLETSLLSGQSLSTISGHLHASSIGFLGNPHCVYNFLSPPCPLKKVHAFARLNFFLDLIKMIRICLSFQTSSLRSCLSLNFLHSKKYPSFSQVLYILGFLLLKCSFQIFF